MGSPGSVASAPIASSKAGGIRQLWGILISLAIGGIFIFVGYWLAIVGTSDTKWATHESVYGLWKVKTTYPAIGWIFMGVGGLIAFFGILITFLTLNVNRTKASSIASGGQRPTFIERLDNSTKLSNEQITEGQAPEKLETVIVVHRSSSATTGAEPVPATAQKKQVEAPKPEEPRIIKLKDEVLSAHDRAEILEEMCQQIGIHKIMSAETKNLSDGEKTILRKKHGGRISGKVVFPISETTRLQGGASRRASSASVSSLPHDDTQYTSE